MHIVTFSRRAVPVFLAALFISGCAHLPGRSVGPASPPAVVSQYRLRLKGVEREMPQIIRAAEAVAKRWVERRQVLFHFPFGGDTSNFSMEFCSRAGGLDNSMPNTVRVERRSTNDVIVVAPRSWEKGGDFLRKELGKARTNGWLIVVFGSRQGMPADLPVDFLIDNGAAGGNEDEAAMNQIVNVTSGWIWCCELTAALTRLGYYPGILRGMPLPGAIAHNKEYQGRSPLLYPTGQPIATGVLARAYLDGIQGILTDLESAQTQEQISQASGIAADYVKAGKTVWASSFTHVLDGEVFLDNKSPIKAFRGISCGAKGETFINNVKEGDLLFYFGEWTLNLPWFDYLAVIRQTRAAYIPGFRRCPEPMEPYEGKADFYDQDVHDARMVLEQRWPFENAVVPIPFPPGKMAPVSGVYLCLQYRMFDAAIARRLDL